MKSLLRVVLTGLLTLFIVLGGVVGASAATKGQVNGFANEQRGVGGAKRLTAHATMSQNAQAAATRCAATKPPQSRPTEDWGSMIPTGTWGIGVGRAPGGIQAAYASALEMSADEMNGHQWTHIGAAFATNSSTGYTCFVGLYGDIPIPAPPVQVDPVPAPAPAPEPVPAPAPAPRPVPAPARPVAPAPAAPAPALEPKPRPIEVPSSSPAPSKRAEATPAPSKSAKPSRSPTTAPTPTPVPSVAPTPMIIERTVNGSGFTAEERHSLSAFLFAGGALSGTVSALSWLVVRRLSRS